MIGRALRSFIRFAVRLYSRCREHRTGRHAAETAYFMLFTIFPFIVFVSAVLSLLSLPAEAILDKLVPVLPQHVYELIFEYLSYIGKKSSSFTVYAGSVLALYMLYRSVTSLNYAVSRALGGLHHKNRGAVTKSLLMSLTLMISVMALLVLFGISRSVYRYLALFFELGSWVRSTANIIRYAAGPLFVFFVLTVYYRNMDQADLPLRRYMPGAALAVSAWYGLSMGFMAYVDLYGGYTDLYGSLASIMVLMIWLHTTASAFIVGAETSAILNQKN